MFVDGFVNLYTRDIEAGLVFYRDLLGFEATARPPSSRRTAGGVGGGFGQRRTRAGAGRTRRCQELLRSITIPAEQVSAFTPFRLQMQEFFMRFEQLAITGGTSAGRPRGAARIC